MSHIFTRLILTALILASGTWQAARAASPFAREVPTAYGKFDASTGSLSLVVAEVVATDT